MVKMTKSKTFQAYLPNCHRTYSCVHCRAHLANHDELISKSFQGSQGRAYLFNSVVNVGCGPAEERVLLTGLHAVADIYCENCKTTLGWKYALGWICSPEWPGHALGQVHVVTGCSWRDGPMDNSPKVCPLEQDCQAHVHKPPSASASSPLSSVSV
ncbi:protein yippee-like 1 isoform X1 [Herpailurus yagouaroundi]|uniref:protein yippee-like 1 isoform X1 n=1 Tax=Felis catus TaxID=9685 RepID=UPI0009485819|nr:protein yippee-like 1 isoform X1 [Felis catus]XP_023097479.1 protein yippee-like 1 isoform X1 [Felis catus]XP_023097480.1 protein yippee-like 1 isoform X1 [Felis catus]XP_040320595.1 protein yippee-like 1 isoform X1 [Puma yagouaroundi]XP_040320596.1 protein yippee-like 1 isoform X1 [Puma yagouaroundi]